MTKTMTSKMSKVKTITKNQPKQNHIIIMNFSYFIFLCSLFEFQLK